MLAPMLAAAVVSSSLLTQEQIESAPVEDLTLKQLYSENARLADPPSLAPSTIMLGVGGGVFVGAGLLSWLAINATSQSRGWATLGWVFVDIIVVAVTVVGAVVAIIGGATLPGRIWQRDRYAERQTQVLARISAIRSGQAQEPYQAEVETPAAVRALAKLEDERPGLGLPIALMASGAGVGVLGGLYWATYSGASASSSSSGIPPYAIGIGLLCAGIAMEGLGIFFLISRLRQRAELDERIEDLQRGSPGAAPPPPPGELDVPPPPPPPPPPSVQLQSPAPVLFSYAWRF